MDRLIVLDTGNSGAGDDKIKGGKTAKGSSIGSVSRKRLADISNLQQQWPKPSIEHVKQQFDSLTNKEYVDNLQKENKTLMKILADRNKIIELSRGELQKLRINLQKVQQQNLQLAQANSLMLAELNSGKDRLKALQHELGCKNGLLKVRKLEAEERPKTVTCQNAANEVGSTKCLEAGESLQADKGNRPCTTKRERQLKNPSLGTPTVDADEVKEKVDNKRRLRRQSARFKTEEREGTGELFETNCDKYSVSSICDKVSHECGLTCSLVEKEDPTVNVVEAKQKPDNKRRITRQSARLKTEEREATEELFESNGEKISVSHLCVNVAHESGPTYSFVEKEHTVEEVQEKQKPENIRRFTRHSARSKTEEREATEDFLKTKGDKFSVSQLCDEVVHEGGSTCSSVKIEDEGNAAPTSEGQECRRSSTRPLRRATEKIKSYKEIPIKVKMRRDF